MEALCGIPKKQALVALGGAEEDVVMVKASAIDGLPRSTTEEISGRRAGLKDTTEDLPQVGSHILLFWDWVN